VFFQYEGYEFTARTQYDVSYA